MNEIFRVIGAVIFSIVMYAAPILVTCSFAFHWGLEVQGPLILLCVLQLVYIIDKNIERED